MLSQSVPRRSDVEDEEGEVFFGWVARRMGLGGSSLIDE
jgi:hypothetical protein